MVEVEPSRAQAKGLSPTDIVNAVLAQNVTLPAGTARFGDTNYDVLINGSPDSTADFNRIPIKVVDGPRPCTWATSRASTTGTRPR